MQTNDEPRYSVVIVDDDQFARDALVLLFTDPYIKVLGRFGVAQEALVAIENWVPHVAVVDIHIDTNIREALAFIHTARRASPATACLVLSALDASDDLRYESIEAGADEWYRLSGISEESPIDIVKRLAEGQSYLSRGTAANLLKQLAAAENNQASYRVPPIPNLTPAERDLLKRRAQGEDRGQIAADLNVSVANLGRHFRNILRKFFLPEAY